MLLALLLSLSARADVLRHALIIGENTGPAEVAPLRHAEEDARNMAEVLTELGGFSADQVTVLYGPDVAEVSAALAAHAQTAKAADADMFFFYYSGHADIHGLRLGKETLSYAALRRMVRDVPAEVRVGVLDACRSGEITRVKGLEVTGPFATDKGLNTEGEAWLTAATAEEAAQESDLLKSSFFTHYLVSGLRGAADTGDGQVSLDEAYAYAYDRTVARTGATTGGTQHPAYDFRLQGKGDLALTDIRRAEARLILPSELSGELAILTGALEAPFAEVSKAAGAPLEIGLPAGRYLLRLRSEGRVQEARIGLTVGSSLTVRGLQALPVAVATAKGADSEGDAPDRPGTLVRLQQSVARGLDSVSAPLLDPLTDTLNSHVPRAETQRSDPRRVTVALPAMVDGGSRQPEVDPRALLSGLPDGATRVLYASGEVAAEGDASRGQPAGRWVFWYPTGTRRTEGVYRRGQRAGTWTWWYADGTRQRRGSYTADVRTGLWTEWYPSGSRRVQISYEAGTPQGRFTAWYASGQEQREGRLLGGEPEGLWQFWQETGARAARGAYIGGEPDGLWITWHANGTRSSQGHYDHGRAVGRWVRWWDNGRPSEIGHYTDGNRTGSWRSWDTEGRRVHL